MYKILMLAVLDFCVDIKRVYNTVILHVLISGAATNYYHLVGASATNVVTRPLRKRPTGTDNEKSSLLRHDSNTSAENADIGPIIDAHEQQHLYSATPPVVLTSGDFYDSVRSTQSNALSAYGELQRPSEQPLLLHVAADSDGDDDAHAQLRQQPISDTEAPHSDSARINARSISQVETQSASDVLIDLTTDSRNEPHGACAGSHGAGAGSHAARADDTHSTQTMDSYTSDLHIPTRRAQTDSMTNYAQFSGEPSLTSTRSSSPSKTSQHSEKQ